MYTRAELETLCKIYGKLISSPGTRVDPAILSTGAPAPVQTVEVMEKKKFIPCQP